MTKKKTTSTKLCSNNFHNEIKCIFALVRRDLLLLQLLAVCCLLNTCCEELISSTVDDKKKVSVFIGRQNMASAQSTGMAYFSSWFSHFQCTFPLTPGAQCTSGANERSLNSNRRFVSVQLYYYFYYSRKAYW